MFYLPRASIGVVKTNWDGRKKIRIAHRPAMGSFNSIKYLDYKNNIVGDNRLRDTRR